jgi:hypothetical protein
MILFYVLRAKNGYSCRGEVIRRFRITSKGKAPTFFTSTLDEALGQPSSSETVDCINRLACSKGDTGFSGNRISAVEVSWYVRRLDLTASRKNSLTTKPILWYRTRGFYIVNNKAPYRGCLHLQYSQIISFLPKIYTYLRCPLISFSVLQLTVYKRCTHQIPYELCTHQYSQT